jgi:hypothetical protein
VEFTLNSRRCKTNKALLLDPFVTVHPNGEKGLAGPNIVFTEANIHITDGSGATDGGGSLLGPGNLVVGYDENVFSFSRSGSHNLVVGKDNGFSGVGGFVAGDSNTTQDQFTSVSENPATGIESSVGGPSLIQPLEIRPASAEAARTTPPEPKLA